MGVYTIALIVHKRRFDEHSCAECNRANTSSNPRAFELPDILTFRRGCDDQDVPLVVLIGIPLVAVLEAPFQWVSIGALSVGVTYGLLRRRLAALAPVVFDFVLDVVATDVPKRDRE